MTLRLGSSPTPACESGSPEAIARVERMLTEVRRRHTARVSANTQNIRRRPRAICVRVRRFGAARPFHRCNQNMLKE